VPKYVWQKWGVSERILWELGFTPLFNKNRRGALEFRDRGGGTAQPGPLGYGEYGPPVRDLYVSVEYSRQRLASIDGDAMALDQRDAMYFESGSSDATTVTSHVRGRSWETCALPTPKVTSCPEPLPYVHAMLSLSLLSLVI